MAFITVTCCDCNREVPYADADVVARHADGHWLYACLNRGDCSAHTQLQPNLDVAFCPGCARMWTRHEVAVELWRNRSSRVRALHCCGYDYDGGYGRRPRTLNELVQGRFGQFTEQEDEVLRTIVLYLTDRQE